MKSYLYFFLFVPLFIFSQSDTNTDFYSNCNEKSFGKPNRTYGGSNWYGGFSDHLPVYCELNHYGNEIFTMFYNVENLFDTIDDPKRNDNSFLPSSDKKWNTNKYFNKLSQLERVFQSANSNKMPNIIGLSEVENLTVIEDLLKQPFFSNHTYSIIHRESPDMRGIDCALLFDKNFSLIKSDFLTVKIPGSKKPTRDIIYVQLKIKNDIINIFVNHWSSRWGGTKETEHKRIYAANVLKKYIEDNIRKNEKIIIMGDFNDYPSNSSLKNILLKTKKNKLTNLMSNLDCGSYNYKGKWGWLDQIIVSSSFLNDKNNFVVKNYGAFVKDWMLYKSNK